MLAVLYSDTFVEHVKIFEGVFVRKKVLTIDKAKKLPRKKVFWENGQKVSK